MEQNNQKDLQNATEFGKVRNDSEIFRNVPHASEVFRTVQNDSEQFRNLPTDSEREEGHTLTVREVARLFENAGVARTERSIVNWCQPNKSGVARLANYFDPNERKYFITPQSVELAIKEEQAKVDNKPSSEGGEQSANVRKDAEARSARKERENDDEAKSLQQEILDLKIMNKGKDFFIEQLQKEREGFAVERQGYVEKLMTFNRKVGELETKLMQLEAPKANDEIET